MSKVFAHQKTAINKTAKALRTLDIAQVVMACRTGKTVVGAKVAGRLKARRVLLLVPNLGLVAQAIDDWRMVHGDRLNVLAVCSDDSVAEAESKDAATVDPLNASVTTDPVAVATYLRHPRAGVTLVVSTYHSSPRVAAAQAMHGVPAFDLAIADEAHHVAGRLGSHYSTITDPKAIRSAKRLYMTATPRIFKASTASNGDTQLSMNDEKVFGPVVHEYKFHDAIRDGILCDFQVVVVPVRSEELLSKLTPKKRTGRAFYETHRIASAVSINKAIREYDVRKVLGFFLNTKRVDEFSDDTRGVMRKAWDSMSPSERPAGALHLFRVSGKDSADKRRDIIDGQFGKLNGDSRSFLGNCRVLGEGVTMPDLDCVAFLDPKQSPIQIVQALSRALGRRKNGQHKKATLFVPAYCRHGDNPDAALDRQTFRTFRDVINALRAVEGEDGRVVAMMNALADSRGSVSGVPACARGWLKVMPGMVKDLEKAVMTGVAKSLSVDPDGKKAKLLRMARDGLARPKAMTPLWCALQNYAGNGSMWRDQEFSIAIRGIRPDWFRSRRSEGSDLAATVRRTPSQELRKQKLLDMAAAGEDRPRAKRSHLGASLCSYTLPSQSAYDGAFSAKLRKIRPDWFGPQQHTVRSTVISQMLDSIAAPTPAARRERDKR